MSNIFFSIIGRLVLFHMYRNEKDMKRIRNKHYAGYYSGAGRVYLLNAIAFTGAASLTILLVVMIFMMIYKWIVGE